MTVINIGSVYPQRTAGEARSFNLENGTAIVLPCGTKLAFAALSAETVQVFISNEAGAYFNAFTLRPCDRDVIDSRDALGCVFEVRRVLLRAPSPSLLVSVVSAPGKCGIKMNLSALQVSDGRVAEARYA